MALIGNLTVTLTAKSDDFERGMSKARREVTQTQQAVAQGALAFDGLGKSIATAALGVVSIGALGAAALQLGKSVLDTGVKMENLRKSFAAIAGSAALGRQEFTFVTDTANRLGLDLTTLATSYQGLSAATRGTALAGTDTQQLFVALSAASRTFGLSTEQTGRALTAFQQIISKGKVSQEELRGQLGEAIPGASQIAARAFGVTTQALDKLIEKGVDATEFTRRFTAQLAKETPVATAQAGAGFARLGNEITLFMDDMAKKGVLKFFDDLAGAAAKLGEARRRQAADVQSGAQRSATRALGGEDPTKLLPDNARRLLEVSELLAQAEEDLRQKQRVLPATAPILGMVQRQVDLLRQKQTELAATIKLSELAAKQGVGLLTEPGPQYEAQEKARRQQVEEQLKRDAEATQDRFKEIDVRTAHEIEAHEKLKQETEKAAREAEQLREKDAAQTIDAFRRVGEERIKALAAQNQAEAEHATAVEAAVVRANEARQHEHDEQLKREEAALQRLRDRSELLNQQLLDQQDPGGRSHREDVRSLQLLRRITTSPEKLAEAQALLTRDKATRDLLDRSRKITALSEDLADRTLSIIEGLSRGSITSFKSFMESIALNVQQILNQQFLKPALSGLIESGLKVVSTYFNTPGGGVSAGSAAGLEGEGALFASNLNARASGGPVMPGGFYRVGERGPETIYATGRGYVIPNGGMPGQERPLPPIIVNINGVQDFSSFQRSQGQLNQGILRAIQNASRAA